MFWVLYSVLSCANWERRGNREMERGEVEQQLNLSRWQIVLLSAWPSGVYLNWWLHHQTLAHQPTMALTTHIHTHTGYKDWSSHRVSVSWWSAWEVRMCVQCVCVVVFGVFVCLARLSLQMHTNVFISTRPVKMSSLCLFSPHSEWHNTGLEDTIINLNVPWHFLTPLSTT